MDTFFEEITKQQQSIHTLFTAARGIFVVWSVFSLFIFIWIIITWKYHPQILGQPLHTPSVIVEPVYENRTVQGTIIFNQTNNVTTFNQTNTYQPNQINIELENYSNLKSQQTQNVMNKSNNISVHSTQTKYPFITKLVYYSQELIFNYLPLMSLSILNVVCFRSWTLTLAVFVISITLVIFLNLIGKHMIINKWIKVFVMNLWMFTHLLFYVNYWIIGI